MFDGAVGDRTHNLNVVTSGEVQLLCLTRASYDEFCSAHPAAREATQQIAMSMEKQLQQLELFKGIETIKMKMLVTQHKYSATTSNWMGWMEYSSPLLNRVCCVSRPPCLILFP